MKLEAQIGVVIFAILMILAVTNRLRFLETKSLITLGAFSYAMYLIHLPIGSACDALFRQVNLMPELSILLATVMAGFASWWTWKYLEIPMAKILRKRLMS